MKTLYLHIGTPKTGTTSLQHFCMKNRAALNARGYEYPEPAFTYLYTGKWRNGHFLLGYTADSDTAPAETLEERTECAYALLAETFERFDSVVLSEENLWTDTARNRKHFFWERLMDHAHEHGYIVKAVVYLRRQDLFAESMYNQLVKQGNRTDDFDAWVARPLQARRLEYYENLERISKFIGHDAITVRVYDRESLDAAGGIHADFLNAIGLEMDESFREPEGDVNTMTLSGNALAIKHLVNMAPSHDRAMDGIFRGAAFACLDRSQASGQRILSSQEAAELLAKYEPGNKKIAAEYLHREGPLFDAAQKDAEKWTPDNPYLYDDIVTYFQCLSAAQAKRCAELAGDAGGADASQADIDRSIEVAALEANPLLNTASCLGEYFAKRQKAILAGVGVALLSDADVVGLVDVVHAASKRVIKSKKPVAYVMMSTSPIIIEEEKPSQRGAAGRFFRRVASACAHPSRILRKFKSLVGGK